MIAIHGAAALPGRAQPCSPASGSTSPVWSATRGEVIQVPVESCARSSTEDKTLSDLILGAFMARRSILIGVGTGIKLIGSRFSPDSRRLREFLARNRMPYQWIDLEEDEDAEALLEELASRARRDPGRDPGGRRDPAQPGERRGGPGDRPRRQGTAAGPLRRLVVGAGPAGPRSGRSTPPPRGSTPRGSRRVATGGQAGTSARIENYLGFPAGVSGSELTQRAGVQAIKFGVAPDRAGRGGGAEERAGPARDRALDRRGRHRPDRGRSPPVRSTGASTCRASRSSRWAASTTRRPRPRPSSAPAIRS